MDTKENASKKEMRAIVLYYVTGLWFLGVFVGYMTEGWEPIIAACISVTHLSLSFKGYLDLKVKELRNK